MEPHGVRLGWWIGGLGSLIWLPIMSLVWLAQGNVEGAMVGLGIAGAGVAYLVFMAPWRFPRTPLRWLFLGFVLILMAGVAWTLWQSWHAFTSGGAVPFVVFWTLFLPVLTWGRKSWSELEGQND